MEKKIYLTPGFKIHKVNVHRIICTSGNVDETPVDNEHLHAKEQKYNSNIWDNEW